MLLLRNYIVYILVFFNISIQLHSGSFEQAADKISKIEKIIQQDPGNRGVCHFYTEALLAATQALEKADHVAILTGFFIPAAQRPETDGPLGSLFLAQSLIAHGKKVIIVTDRDCLPAIQACFDVIKDQINPEVFAISLFPENKEDHMEYVSHLCSSVNCLVSIERVGRSADGTYRTMRAIDITEKTAPLDDLFIYAQTHPEMNIVTIAVGDGGNEIGMGEMQEEVKEFILNGEKIACIVPADHLIVTGVSNWGGYALAGSLWCIMDENAKSLSSLDQVYPTNKEQFDMLKNMIDANCCDGVLGKPVLSVDGLPWEVHEKILNDIRELL